MNRTINQYEERLERKLQKLTDKSRTILIENGYFSLEEIADAMHGIDSLCAFEKNVITRMTYSDVRKLIGLLLKNNCISEARKAPHLIPVKNVKIKWSAGTFRPIGYAGIVNKEVSIDRVSGYGSIITTNCEDKCVCSVKTIVGFSDLANMFYRFDEEFLNGVHVNNSALLDADYYEISVQHYGNTTSSGCGIDSHLEELMSYMEETIIKYIR